MLNYRKGFVYIWFDKKHKRYYIFKKVLSLVSITNCLHKFPKTGFHSIQGDSGRKFCQDGSSSFSKFVRAQLVYCEDRKIGITRKTVTFGEFYPIVARKLGFLNPHLCPTDKALLHLETLTVYRCGCV